MSKKSYPKTWRGTKQPPRYDAVDATPSRARTDAHIASLLAIHEATHATANFLLGMTIASVDVQEREGTVHVLAGGDSFDRCVSLLAPHVLEEMFGWEPSGDTFDEDEVDRILRATVSPGAVDEAHAVLTEAARKLVLRPEFDVLRRRLSSQLKPGTILDGHEVERILHDAYEEYRERYGNRERARAAHMVAGAGAWEVSIGGPAARVLYRGSSREEAERVQRQHPRSQLFGSIYGGGDS